MPKPKPTPAAETPSRTWRDIAQSGGRKPTTPAARQRRFSLAMQATGAFLGLVLMAAAIGFLIYLANAPGRRLNFANPRDPVRQVSFTSNGVLTRDWFLRTQRELMGKPLMEVDLQAVKRTLLANGQVREAVAAINLPDRLEIRIAERQPILRARLAMPDGRVDRDWLIASDGVIFKGQLYPAKTMANLPFLAGLRFSRQGDGFAPLTGMEVVAECLEALRARLPEVYSSLRYVDCRKFAGDPGQRDACLILASSQWGEIRLLPRNFEGQFDRLREILTRLPAQENPAVQRIDLTVTDQVIVRYADAVRPAAKPTRRG